MAAYYDPSDEPVSDKPFTFDMEFDDLPTQQLKKMVHKVSCKVQHISAVLSKKKSNLF